MSPLTILKIGLFLVPLWYFFPAPGLNVLPRQGQFVMMMAVGCGALAFTSRNWWFRAFCLYAVAWVLFAQVATMLNVCPESIMASMEARDFLRHLLVGLVVFAVVRNSRAVIDSWANWICAAACLHMLIGIPQRFGWSPEVEFLRAIGMDVEGTLNKASTGLLENPNFFAGYLAISAPFFFRKYWAWCLPVLMVHVALSETSTAVAALAAAFFVYFRGQWVLLAGIGAAGLLVLLTDASSTLASPRWAYWREMVTGFRWESLFNVAFGFGPFARWMHGWHPHSEYIKLWWDFGPGALVMAGGYLWSLRKAPPVLLAALAAAAVDCIGSFPLYLPPSAYLIIVILALIEREEVTA
ncbi:MAG: hypothetical protein A4E73_00299 [Syntrophaceae bacterium PtaU1.Bin231]|nr:MAG: hypothetical protein A4E73_00299 [Syntrophaceae bacterium PtaU1.Bin231]